MTVYANIPFIPAIWMDLPAVYPQDAPDAESWGRLMSSACWTDSGLPHGDEELRYLAEVLTSMVTSFGPDAAHPEHAVDPGMEIWTLLHLPDPRVLPVPVRVMVLDEHVVRREKTTVSDLVQVEDPEAIDQPEVVEFEHPHLDSGLRAFRHRASESGHGPSSGIFAVLKYAFPIPGHDDLLYVSLSWPDLARVAEARDDIDTMVRSITTEHHPDPEPAGST